jgi:integrase
MVAAGDGDYTDGGGLMLRIRGTSSTWVYRFTSPSGKRREMGLGPAVRGTLEQAGASLRAARDHAHDARELVRRGVDPIDERDRRREHAQQHEQQRKADRQRDRWTLARCARDYHERVIEPKRTSKHSAQWISSLENHVPTSVWHKPIADVTAPELLQALASIKPHERNRHAGVNVAETAKRIRQRLEAVFEDAQFHGRCDTNPAAAIKRKLSEEGPERLAGEFRALDYRAAPALVQRLRAMPGTAARALEFAVLSVARSGEVLGATWNEIDVATAVWRVPAARMKGGEDHAVYLPARAVEIVREQVGQSTKWVFPSPASVGTKATRPLSNMAMLAVLDRLGVRDATTVHGLCRSTFSTWANETAAARPDVIEACLAHSEGDRVRAAYNRAQFADERRALLAAWCDYLQRPAALALVA